MVGRARLGWSVFWEEEKGGLSWVVEVVVD